MNYSTITNTSIAYSQTVGFNMEICPKLKQSDLAEQWKNGKASSRTGLNNHSKWH
jgi:hypothetical protein